MSTELPNYRRAEYKTCIHTSQEKTAEYLTCNQFCSTHASYMPPNLDEWSTCWAECCDIYYGRGGCSPAQLDAQCYSVCRPGSDSSQTTVCDCVGAGYTECPVVKEHI